MEEKEKLSLEEMQTLFKKGEKLTSEEKKILKKAINKEFIMWYLETYLDEKQIAEFLAKGEKTEKKDDRVVAVVYTKYKMEDLGEKHTKGKKKGQPKLTRVYDETSPQETVIQLFGAKKYLIEDYLTFLKTEETNNETKEKEQNFLNRYLKK